MKKVKLIILCFAAIIAAFLIIGCPNPMQDGGASGTIAISMGSSANRYDWPSQCPSHSGFLTSCIVAVQRPYHKGA